MFSKKLAALTVVIGGSLVLSGCMETVSEPDSRKFTNASVVQPVPVQPTAQRAAIVSKCLPMGPMDTGRSCDPDPHVVNQMASER